MSEEEAQRISYIYEELVKKRAPLDAIMNTNICKDGRMKILETSGVPFFNTNGELLGYRGIDRDITARLHAEQALHKSEEIMLTQSKQAAMGEMISMIAHQWRQPLNVIGLAVANIQTKKALDILDEQSIDENAVIIADNITFMSDTIDDFRNYFKPDAKQELTNVQEVIDIVYKIIGTSLKNNNIIFNVENNTTKEFWLSHILILVSTVFAVYLAAKAGLETAVEFEVVQSDRNSYYLQSSLMDEFKDNTDQVIEMCEICLDDRYALYLGKQGKHELDKFIWTAMQDSADTFEVPGAVLTGVRRYYKSADKTIYSITHADEGGYWTQKYKEKVQALLKETKATKARVLPRMQKELDRLENNLKKHNIDL